MPWPTVVMSCPYRWSNCSRSFLMVSIFSCEGPGFSCRKCWSWDICSSRAASTSVRFPDAICCSQITPPSRRRNPTTKPTISAFCFSHLRFILHEDRFQQFGPKGEGEHLSLYRRVRWHIDDHARLVEEP